MVSLGLPLEGLLLRGQDLLLVIGLLVLFFGAKKIPDLAKGLGEGIRNFKHSVKDEPKPEPVEKKEEEKQQV
jgi:sec-independent protein translocase protein TatA